MCGRFAVFSQVQDILAYKEFLESLDDFTPHYNVAPGQNSLVATYEDGVTHLRSMRWGLVPGWSKDAKVGAKLINARSETASQKPSFRQAFDQRRCLVLANGFYEWGRADKQPWFIRPKGRELFAFAGLWEQWDGGDAPLHTFTILTTAPSELMQSLHERMPVILPRESENEWLQRGGEALLKPYPAQLEGWPVSRAVNRVVNDFESLIEPIEQQSELW